MSCICDGTEIFSPVYFWLMGVFSLVGWRINFKFYFFFSYSKTISPSSLEILGLHDFSTEVGRDCGLDGVVPTKEAA